MAIKGSARALWDALKAQVNSYRPRPKAPPCGHQWRRQQVMGKPMWVCLKCGTIAP